MNSIEHSISGFRFCRGCSARQPPFILRRGENRLIRQCGESVEDTHKCKSRPKAALSIRKNEADLDAQAEFAGLLFSGVGVKIIGIAVVELVAAKQFATHEEAHCSHGQPTESQPITFSALDSFVSSAVPSAEAVASGSVDMADFSCLHDTANTPIPALPLLSNTR